MRSVSALASLFALVSTGLQACPKQHMLMEETHGPNWRFCTTGCYSCHNKNSLKSDWVPKCHVRKEDDGSFTCGTAALSECSVGT